VEKLPNEQRGFTLIGAVTVQIVLIIAALATCSAFVVGKRFNAESESKTVAANIAQLKIEDIKSTHYLSIVHKHPAGVALFESEPQREPYWTRSPQGKWETALLKGQYEISYPGLDLVAGVIPDPLVVKVTILWGSDVHTSSSLSLKTTFDMTPGPIMKNGHSELSGIISDNGDKNVPIIVASIPDSR